MKRLRTMSRFSEPTDEKPVCHCEQCEKELFEGDGVYKTQDGYFCSDDCILEFSGATGVVLWSNIS